MLRTHMIMEMKRSEVLSNRLSPIALAAGSTRGNSSDHQSVSEQVRYKQGLSTGANLGRFGRKIHRRFAPTG